jgi:hypothetical protein
LKETESSLQNGEVIVSGGFSENYSFIIRDAAQGFHQNNQQATIHPFVSYFKNSKNELGNLCFVIISQCLCHDTVTVYTFQKHLIAFLKENFPKISKIYYFFLMVHQHNAKIRTISSTYAIITLTLG